MKSKTRAPNPAIMIFEIPKDRVDRLYWTRKKRVGDPTSVDFPCVQG